MDKKSALDIDIRKKESALDNNSVKKVTQRILRMDGNGLNLAIDFLICLVLIITPYVVSMLPAYAFSYEDEDGNLMTLGIFSLMSFAILIGGWVFVSLPSIGGYMQLANDIVDDKEHTLAGLFSVYKYPKKYFRCMLYGLLWLICVALLMLPLIGAVVQIGRAHV